MHSADISESIYAIHTRQLLDAIDQIRDIGGQLKLDLPRIVVIGNQSAGKSSLIEAIARINVPRGGGTCTRCPTEIRLRSSSDPWKCSVSLRYEYDSEGNLTGDSLIIPFGEDVLDPSHVEVMLRRAQIAVLNNERNPRMYLDIDPSQLQLPEDQRQFSKNIVCIEVSGPLLTDLTFVDLPGIIQHHPTDSNLVELIKSMTREYISDPSALILCTITMKDDPENQAALGEAKIADPEGTRTIGVLTKPDTLQSQEEEQWLSVLKNEGRHRLKLGYYITKQPAQVEVEQRVAFDTARQNEQEFFKNVKPWCNLPGRVSENVGTPRLTAMLSQLLSGLIRKSLPDIDTKIRQFMQEVDEGIQALASVVSAHPVADIILLCERFRSELDHYTSGSPGYEKLVQENYTVLRSFQKDIRNTAPQFIPYTAREHKRNISYVEPLDIVEDWANKEDGDTYHLETLFTLCSAKTRELPFNVPYAVKVQMMLLPIKRWKDLANACFTSIHPQIGSLIEGILHSIFGGYDQTLLLERVKGIVFRQLNVLVTDTKGALELLFDMEDQGTLTLNDFYYSSTRSKLIAHYHEVRRKGTSSSSSSHCASSTAPACQTSSLSEVLIQLQVLGYPVSEDDLKRLTEKDRWEEEIVVMAETRAYFQVAYKRFVDNIHLAIDRVFVRPLAAAMLRALVSDLQFDSPDAHERCKSYLAESPQKAAQRQRLNADRVRLEKASEALKAIGFGN
ncbi:hypothetical protein CALCODRAFT_428450 [Calocera cornea HHB12733]|uniref:P-loop containing nucleoside triphosphate hydrolase protein n=1 Tax=Calocera cornea HHB12733 TaxID=1353952 RepID=A0A165IVQ7_9BASI|nr:hypothetical protein CALCODRAFT_428450 [Calocera cornea HHB12733]